jgi:CubicO group peptidase (beta-lactamase class C family)
LLYHTSGIDRDGKLPQWVTYEFPSLQQFQQQIAAGSMIYAPAEHWKYSNYGFTLLGAVIQAVSGVSYEEYVTEHIVKQLGLTHTAPVLTDAVMQQLALGYSRELPEQAREAFPHIETHVMAPATGFSSNIHDFCQFMLAQFNGDSRLLKDGTKREMRRLQWRREGFISDWCLGFETWKINQSRYYGHGGSFQGYRSRFGFDPERQIGLVIFSNAIDAPSQDLAHGALGIIDYVITHFSEFEAAESAPEQIEKYEGTFRSIWGDVSITAVQNKLLLYVPGARSLEGEISQLRHEQEHQFTMVNGSGFDHVGEVLRFELDDQGVARRVYVGPNPSDRFEVDPLIGG